MFWIAMLRFVLFVLGWFWISVLLGLVGCLCIAGRFWFSDLCLILYNCCLRFVDVLWVV